MSLTQEFEKQNSVVVQLFNPDFADTYAMTQSLALSILIWGDKDKEDFGVTDGENAGISLAVRGEARKLLSLDESGIEVTKLGRAYLGKEDAFDHDQATADYVAEKIDDLVSDALELAKVSRDMEPGFADDWMFKNSRISQCRNIFDIKTSPKPEPEPELKFQPPGLSPS